MKTGWILAGIIGMSFLVSCNKELIDVEPDGYFTDPRDSLVYPYAQMGDAVWMIRNLMYDCGEGCWVYNNEEKYLKDYGRLYIFDKAVRVCPEGWHLPTDKEWKDLEISQGMRADTADLIHWRHDGEVGIALKNESGWWEGGNGRNTSRFSALPGGFRGLNGNFYTFGDVATYWTSTWSSEEQAWGRALVYYETGVYRWRYDKLEGYSVRCVRD